MQQLFNDPKALDRIKDILQGNFHKGLVQMTLLGGAFAALVGGFILLADEISSPSKRMITKALTAAGAGAVLGATAGFLAQLFFSWLASRSVLFLPVARMGGWAIMGLGAGAGVGVAVGVWKRAKVCIIGGLIGGIVGGALFDWIGIAFGSGTPSRFIGFIVLAAGVAAAMCFAEDAVKRCWVTLLSGPREGRSYILAKPVTTVGRDELADIPLFGDMSVARQHANLVSDGYKVVLSGIGGQSVMVNNAPAHDAELKDSDLIQIGKFSLRFHRKASKYASHAGAYSAQPGTPIYGVQCPPQYAQPSSPYQTQYAPQLVPQSLGTLALTVVAGPHTGLAFQLTGPMVKIGREADCGILLAQDTLVSRYHAQIAWDGSCWQVQDTNSRNGTWVNGVRIQSVALIAGYQVGIGQSVIRVDTI